jgi:hypothetical protein
MIINYKIIQKALNYYISLDYKYLEVPWMVSESALKVTLPKDLNTTFDSDKKYIVASGEQSFMELILNNPNDFSHCKYCCATPCYRERDGCHNDGLHFSQFFKVELINYFPLVYSCSKEITNKLWDMMQEVKYFMEKTRVEDVSIINTVDEPRQECITHISYDIVSKEGVELGSYGVRTHPKIGCWVYGTGAALPRLMYGLE